MRRRDLDYAVVAGLLISGLYVTVSGLLADLFGFPQFFLHPAAGYVCAGLALVHLALNWRQSVAYLRRRIRPRTRPEHRPTHPPAQAAGVSRRTLLVSAATAAGGFVIGRLIPGQASPGPSEAATDAGAFYHQWSKPGYGQLPGGTSAWGGRPEPYKRYTSAERTALPDPRALHGLNLEQAIETRRSHRTFSAGSLPLEELSRLLHAASGITDSRRGFRAAPSAGALYPIEMYAVVHNVAGLAAGLYHYDVLEHTLEQLQAADLRAPLVVTGIGQQMLGRAQVCLILSAIVQRTRWRYRERTYRYVMLEAGHIAQNIYLSATSMGLGACAVGAFLDDELNNLLGLDGSQEAALYVMAVGRI